MANSNFVPESIHSRILLRVQLSGIIQPADHHGSHGSGRLSLLLHG